MHIVIIVIGVVSVAFVLAHIGGWYQLAKAYQEKEKYEGSKSYCVFNPGNLGYIPEKIGFDDFGLHLGMVIFFRLGHPPLKIPYSDIIAKDIGGVLFDWVSISSTKTPGVFLLITKEQAETIKLNNHRLKPVG